MGIKPLKEVQKVVDDLCKLQQANVDGPIPNAATSSSQSTVTITATQSAMITDDDEEPAFIDDETDNLESCEVLMSGSCAAVSLVPATRPPKDPDKSSGPQRQTDPDEDVDDKI